MRKYCWLYENREHGYKVIVQRPRRRAINGMYQVKARAQYGSWRGGWSLRSVAAAQFRKQYKYIGRAKPNRSDAQLLPLRKVA